MSWFLLIVVALFIALLAFGAGWLAGRAGRRAAPMDATLAAENADLRRRMDELADALLATDRGASS